MNRSIVTGVVLSVGGDAPAVLAEARETHTAVPMNHSPYFAPAPALAVKAGVEAMALAMINVLSSAS